MATSGKVDLEKLRIDVQVKFDQIREALNVREKLLLRQIDVILTSQHHKNVSASNTTTGALSPSAADDIQFITDNEENLLNSIRSFGKFNFALQGLYTNEDYIAPAIDHETMYKCLSNTSDRSNGNDEESIVVDFSANRRLFRDNLTNVNESIINITLNEAKELIQKSNNKMSAAIATDPPELPLNFDGIHDDDDDENNDGMPVPTHSKSSQTITNARKPRFKPKITINNCNGTINLKNISNLTINCAKEDSFKATESSSQNNNVEPPKSTTIETTATSNSSAGSNHSNSESSSSAISPKRGQNRHMYVEYHDDENRSATCEFYNRLLSEIKHSLKQKTPKVVEDNRRYVIDDENDDNDEDGNGSQRTPVDTSITDDANGNETSVTSQTTAPNKKLVLRNFENLKIILEANDNNDAMRPVQIEQWLAEIISETEIEPMQNTDILEHSKINSGTC